VAGKKKGAFDELKTPERRALIAGSRGGSVIAGGRDVQALGGAGRCGGKHSNSVGHRAAACDRADFPGADGHFADPAVAAVGDEDVP
jgi:hypothetical protein